MRNITKIVFLLLLAGCMAFSIVGCKKNENTKSLYVGTNAEFEPFEYLDNGKIVGFDIELINEIGKIIGYEIVIKNMAFDGLLPALQSKKIDAIIAGMTADDERRKSVNFSSPYFTSKQAILVNKDNKDIKSFNDLKGRNVGVALGFTGDIVVTELGGVNVQRYNSTSDTIMGLNAKKVEAVVLDFEPAKNYVKYNSNLQHIETDLPEESYSIALSKGNEDLLKKIDTALETLRTNGTYDKLIKKYFNK